MLSPRHVDDIREQIPGAAQAGVPCDQDSPTKISIRAPRASIALNTRNAAICKSESLDNPYSSDTSHLRSIIDTHPILSYSCAANQTKPHRHIPPPTRARCPSTHPPTRSPCCASTAGGGTSCAGATPRSAPRPPPTGPATSRWETPRSCASSRAQLTSSRHGAREEPGEVVGSGPSRTRRPRWP